MAVSHLLSHFDSSIQAALGKLLPSRHHAAASAPPATASMPTAVTASSACMRLFTCMRGHMGGIAGWLTPRHKLSAPQHTSSTTGAAAACIPAFDQHAWQRCSTWPGLQCTWEKGMQVSWVRLAAEGRTAPPVRAPSTRRTASCVLKMWSSGCQRPAWPTLQAQELRVTMVCTSPMNATRFKR